MKNLDILKKALKELAGLPEPDFSLSEEFWHERSFKKGELFNNYQNVCKELGFILEGTFRSYIIDQKTGEEKNVFFYSPEGFVVSFKSFINQIPCEYYTEALTDAQIIYIGIHDLQHLYRASHHWERLGRLLAQMAFNVVINRVERFLLQSPEEHYLSLLQEHPNLIDDVPLYHISSYLGIQGPSLSRIRKRLAGK